MDDRKTSPKLLTSNDPAFGGRVFSAADGGAAGEEGPVTTIDEDSPIFGWLWSDEHAHQLESLMVETMV
jgi:hypothetical protein